MFKSAFYSFIFGMLSASALPLGALVAKQWKPKQKIGAFMMAFGAGAVLAVITIDLVSNALKRENFFSLVIGCIIGGILFAAFNRLINKFGGFLRKEATTIDYLKDQKVLQFKSMLEKLSQVQIFNQLPPEDIQELVPNISHRTYLKGSILIKQGDPGDSLFIVEHGEVEVVDDKNNYNKIAILTEGAVLGEMALVTGEPRSVTAIATTDTKVWIVLKEYFDKLLRIYPELREEAKKLVSSRISDLHKKQIIDINQAERWVSKAIKNIDSKLVIPTEADILELEISQKSRPLSIWMGCFLDAFPESFIIGSSLVSASISTSLVAGFFISNFPESLSSSIEMQHQNYSFKRIFWMWTSIMILTGFGAFFSNLLFTGVKPITFSVLEGMSAGAMLVMISETMLPEAYYKGGEMTGISTLLGFLATLSFKVF